MKVLAVDTATATCGVAVVTDRGVAADMSTAGGRSHARRLMTLIDAALDAAGLALSDLDGFGVTVGPGSFTGVRIGVSTVQGLSMATGKPAVGLSSLEALGRQDTDGRPRCTMIDARRSEVYAAVYVGDGGRLSCRVPPCVAPLASLMPRLPKGCRYIGSGAFLYRGDILRYDETADIDADERCHRISAITVGRFAVHALADHRHAGAAPPVLPMPQYVRASDAERNRQAVLQPPDPSAAAGDRCAM